MELYTADCLNHNWLSVFRLWSRFVWYNNNRNSISISSNIISTSNTRSSSSINCCRSSSISLSLNLIKKIYNVKANQIIISNLAGKDSLYLLIPTILTNGVSGTMECSADYQPVSKQSHDMMTENTAWLLTHWGRDNPTPFRRRHFQMHFLERKCLNSDQNFTEVCSQGSI